MGRTGAEALHLVGREARDAANHPAVHKTALPTKTFRAPNGNSAAVTKALGLLSDLVKGKSCNASSWRNSPGAMPGL